MLASILRPTLLIDEAKCRANIKQMFDKAIRSEVIFRPHFKTHHSVMVAGWFREFGVSKITVSSLEMALQYSLEGWEDITIAFPANLREINGYNALSSRIKLNLLIDDPKVASALSEGIKHQTGILIEVDCGYGRSGVSFDDLETIDKIIQTLKGSETLAFKGFLSHFGNTYQVDSKQGINDLYDEGILKLKSLKHKYVSEFPEMIISIGDTPSCSIVDDLSEADEIRPGNFVYYDLMQYDLGVCELKNIAVSVACPVVGIYPKRNEIVIYGGAVHLSKEHFEKQGNIFGLVVQFTKEGWSAPVPETRLISISQEHGVIQTSPEFIAQIKHGDFLGILPVHSCLTANLLKDSIVRY